MAVPLWAWAAAVGVICVLLVIDLVANRRPTEGLRRAVVMTAAWIAAGVTFGLVMGVWRGPSIAGQYFAGYVLEKALSVDNVFVFALLFRAFAVPLAHQRRVLSYGVFGALALRAAFIAAGAAALDSFSWMFYAFGAFLLVAGGRMAFGEVHVAPERNVVLRALRRVLPMAPDYVGSRFFVRTDGRLTATPLLAVLVAIETADVVFATDSIPAVFGVTRDVFVVFTSNAFAILGLRALYFVLAGAMDRFGHLSKGLAAVLVFIGVKMLVKPVAEVPLWVTLTVIVVVLGVAVTASLWRPPPSHRQPPRVGGSEAGC